MVYKNLLKLEVDFLQFGSFKITSELYHRKKNLSIKICLEN